MRQIACPSVVPLVASVWMSPLMQKMVQVPMPLSKMRSEPGRTMARPPARNVSRASLTR